jgi:hypothetical protein
MNKPLVLLTAAVVGLFLTTTITIGYGSIPPPLSDYSRYVDPADPNNMTKTCANVANTKNVLPMDILACADWFDNATSIRFGLDPADKDPIDEENIIAKPYPGYE